MITVRNKFDSLPEISETYTLNDKYENFVTTHIEAAAESIPTKPRGKCRTPWESIARKNEIMCKKHPY